MAGVGLVESKSRARSGKMRNLNDLAGKGMRDLRPEIGIHPYSWRKFRFILSRRIGLGRRQGKEPLSARQRFLIELGALDEQGAMPDQAEIIEQIERCRRLARQLTDAELRESLEELARSYEARLEREGDGFMLRSARRDY